LAEFLQRFASVPFKLLETPSHLQNALIDEYRGMLFEPIKAEAKIDTDYGASVIHGISHTKSNSPDLSYSPISQDLTSLAYSEITPLLEKWAGVELEPSWGHGIRSYGRGSILHVHRDRVDTHVVSCIVHVDDQSEEPWSLDFVDHEGEHHSVNFETGKMLFYESLCPHARRTPFAGEYYRNMYFHWRPRQWDPAPYASMRCKFSTIQEAQSDVKRWALIDSIPADWREWLLLNRDRGCAHEGMIQRSERRGFTRSAAEAILGLTEEEAKVLRLSSPASAMASQPAVAAAENRIPTWLHWFEAPLTRSDHQPKAWRLDTPLAQVYELPTFLSRDDCEELMAAIDRSLVPSTVTRGDSSYRTSRTCHLRHVNPDLVARVDQRLAALFDVDPVLSEPLQGQRYDPGQYFKEHTDWFAPGTDEFTSHTNPGGQRTWTVMIYLNTVPQGGQTCFKRLGRCYTPVQGMALAWNNLMADGTPNPFTLHEAMPLEDGSKWVVTKWFRAQPGRNS